ncbi:hypothetical protein pdam_00010010 [Pocillopora damicornis]|uniref:Endonuclease/exonuclease/phosphatase domain-containing protein n=1 Tax=Pocillopora damicornis TaxID=46731 RepID=A0A3M6T5C3_POCDA|nr:hypothetical protein pdam_00010010 [Pocillopora damicornis]
MYRPPKDLSFYEKLEKLDKQLQHISRRRNNIFIIGDLNSDVSSKPSENGSKLKQILRKHGLSNVIKDYTRVTETSRSTIDLSITSKKCQIKTAGKPPPVIREVTDWKNINIESFKESLSQVPWHVRNTFDEVDDNYWLLQYMYNEIANDHLKKRKAKVRITSLPWINGEIRKLMNKRYKQLRKAQTTNSPGLEVVQRS